jgi:transcriptional regulator with AAA-type ATPase domain
MVERHCPIDSPTLPGRFTCYTGNTLVFCARRRESTPIWDSRDITIPEVDLPERSRSRDYLCLTILYHPQVERIGEMTSLRELELGRELLLSRAQLDFAHPADQRVARPLMDPYISRQPLALRLHKEALELQSLDHGSSISINRHAVRDSHRVPLAELADGVVLLMARRVVLLLHYSRDVSCGGDPCEMVGESAGLQGVRQLIQRVAATDATVLLLGESGTGKELVARAIHRRSGCADKEMLSVNMAAIPQELAAAELFGVRRGAFTGADADKPGFFAQADGSTLFLDEVGACAGTLQPLLLRALEEGEIQPSGGVVETVSVRTIAATDLALEDSDFSVALRHRLGGFEIHIPPLRERREDIGRLLAQVLADFMPDEVEADPVLIGRWALLVQDFAGYHWPGNVRQLINFARQIAIASADGTGLVIPDNILKAFRDAPASSPVVGLVRNAREIGDSEIRAAMLTAQFEISRAARSLEISRQALYQRLKSIPQIRIAADVPSAEVEAVYHDCNGELDSAASLLQVSRSGLRRRWRALELEPRGH